jgi:hypothetical protein
MASYKNHPYCTHQPFLIETFKNISGDILECGCGYGSTVLLNNLIKSTSRKLISLETDLNWLNKYTYLINDNHKIYHIDTSSINDVDKAGPLWIDFIKNNNLSNFEIIFIDSSSWLSRKYIFEYYLDKAKIIIMHDFDYFPENNLIGTITKKDIIYYNNNKQIKIECNLDNIVKNYKLFYPPKEYFMGETGPPTLICSNLMSDIDFNVLLNTIENNLNLYY